MRKPFTVSNSFIPFGKYAAINLFGVIFVRKGVMVNSTLLNHEMIHTRQMKELLYIGFYATYLIFWLFYLFKSGFNNHMAYLRIPFEREAYANEHNLEYLSTRKPLQWLNY